VGPIHPQLARDFVNFPMKTWRKHQSATEIPDPPSLDSEGLQDGPNPARAEAEILAPTLEHIVDVSCNAANENGETPPTIRQSFVVNRKQHFFDEPFELKEPLDLRLAITLSQDSDQIRLSLFIPLQGCS